MGNVCIKSKETSNNKLKTYIRAIAIDSYLAMYNP